MRCGWDEAKRRRTLAERGLDFADAERVFAGDHFTREDDRRDYGERRFISAGYLDARFVVVVWVRRAEETRTIPMRHGHAEGETHYRERMGGSR